MIQLLRRLLLSASLLTCLIAFILLLNITAPNPTGRRYSSVAPATTGGGQFIGDEGEAALALDLRLPNNNNPDQRQCVCAENSTASGGQCRVCIAQVPLQSPGGFRIPDFVTPSYIAESKNRRVLLISDYDIVAQLSDYAAAARTLRIPLFVYVRVNTDVSPEITQLIASTGGAVVPYFTVPGYIDPVDETARNLLIIAAPILALTALWELSARRTVPSLIRTPATPTSPKPSVKVDDAEAFARRARERQQSRADREDSRFSPND